MTHHEVSVVVLGPASLTRDVVVGVMSLADVHVVDTATGDDAEVAVLVEPVEEHWEMASCVGARVVVVGRDRQDRDTVLSAFRRGANAVLRTDVDAAGLREVVRTVAAGGSVLDDEQTSFVLDALRHQRTEAPSLRLTPRETAILTSVRRGESIKQTARSLGIAAKTVENLQSRLFRKLGVRNRAQAVAAAHCAGLLRDEAAVVTSA